MLHPARVEQLLACGAWHVEAVAFCQGVRLEEGPGSIRVARVVVRETPSPTATVHSQRTEVRTLYDDHAIYIGARPASREILGLARVQGAVNGVCNSSRPSVVRTA